MQYNIPPELTGLSASELTASRKKHGYNQTVKVSKGTWYTLLLAIVKEPMLVLLIAITFLYVVIGNYSEAFFMACAIIAVSGISFYQDNRSKKALEALEKLNEPLSVVIRNAQVIHIPTHEIAIGDLCVVTEGKMINADGQIVHSNDFSVNEASLTGESYSVYKSSDTSDNKVYSGTLVVSGLAVFRVEKIGNETKLGKIGASIAEIKEEASPLQLQIQRFVRGMAVVGIFFFFAVWGYGYWQNGDVLESLLGGLTLAMSVLPEEIPVAFTTFMALGAWKLMKDGIIVKRSSVVETLGSTTVICTDKTGTITENSMQLIGLYDFKTNRFYKETEFEAQDLSELIQYAMWASEPVPFDPMEKALHQLYTNTIKPDKRGEYQMVYEYPLEGKPPMMTHVFQDETGHRIIAAKGAAEALIEVSGLAGNAGLQAQIESLGRQGYRVLGVGKSNFKGEEFPASQQEIPFEFLGLTVFYDPPKAGIQQVFQKIYAAGIKVKVITGDNSETTKAIAKQAGISNSSTAVNGNQVIQASPSECVLLTRNSTLFTRMFPEAKLAAVNALKNDGEVVAMLGDGVNDAPALKAAHIGVAMGNKGTEIAKAAALMVITNDDLGKLITGIEAGRRIYANLKKAIQYIISIHIPIILTVSLPLFLNWKFPYIFTPVHVIFLELIMGPTCSIVYENEPMEKNTMVQKPRKMTETFLNIKELSISIIQGLVITLGVLVTYQWAVGQGKDEKSTRAMVFTTLIIANILLSLVNRSFIFSILDSLKFKNILFPMVISITILLLMVILYVPFAADFFQVRGLNSLELSVCLLAATLSVLWVEVYKGFKRYALKLS